MHALFRVCYLEKKFVASIFQIFNFVHNYDKCSLQTFKSQGFSYLYKKKSFKSIMKIFLVLPLIGETKYSSLIQLYAVFSDPI